MSANESRPIIYVVYQSGNLANGGIQSLTEILRGLAHRRRIVITLTRGPATEVWRGLGCEVIEWVVERPPWSTGVELVLSRAKRAPELIARNLELARLIRREGARFVHCNDITAFWFAAAGARLAGARVLFNVRDMFPRESSYGPRWRMTRLLADEIVCLSAGMRDEVNERIALPAVLSGARRQAHVGYIYSAVDLERMRPADDAERARLREMLGVPTNGLLLSNVGAICDKKNQLGMIERVLPVLAKELPQLTVLFAGDFVPEKNPYAANCAARVRELGLEKIVRFHGFTRDASVVYRASDLTAFTSRYEGLPRCMIESLACGVPVVGFDVTSVREFLEVARTGEAIAWGDYDAMTRAIVRLFRDEAERRALGARAREVALASFERTRAVRQYEAIYDAS